MTSLHTRIVGCIAAVAAVAAVSACSKSEDHGQHAASSTIAAPPVAVHNAQDVMFAQMMIPHHQQALELAALVPGRSTNPAVAKLADAIAAQQQPEINAMKAQLAQWEVDPHGMAGHGGMPMTGMVDDATMAKLKTLQGKEFDTLWLQSMIGHHQGAIEMAGAEVAGGQSPDMIAMAQNIVTVQQTEIDQMKQMLGG